MNHLNPASRRSFLTFGLLLGAIALLGVTMGARAADAADQKDQPGRGKFMSFKDGTLTLKGNYGVLAWHNVTEKTQVLR